MRKFNYTVDVATRDQMAYWNDVQYMLQVRDEDRQAGQLARKMLGLARTRPPFRLGQGKAYSKRECVGMCPEEDPEFEPCQIYITDVDGHFAPHPFALCLQNYLRVFSITTGQGSLLFGRRYAYSGAWSDTDEEGAGFFAVTRHEIRIRAVHQLETEALQELCDRLPR